MGQAKSKPAGLWFQLATGDHICVERNSSLLFPDIRHGIYVGNNMVIYLQKPSKGSSPPCQQCGYDRNCSGRVIKTCLDCFLDGHNIDFFSYGGFPLGYIRERSKPEKEVVKMATYFLEADADAYKAVAKDCQGFAVYCKTGKAFIIDERTALLLTTGSGPTILGGFRDVPPY